MFGYSYGWGLFRIAEPLVGVALIVNCVRGLISQQWVYDRQSSKMMNASQLLGVLIGLALIADGVWFYAQLWS